MSCDRGFVAFLTKTTARFGEGRPKKIIPADTLPTPKRPPRTSSENPPAYIYKYKREPLTFFLASLSPTPEQQKNHYKYPKHPPN